MKLENLKKRLYADGLTDDMIIENDMENAKMISIAFDGEGKDANEEYLMSVVVGKADNYVDSVHVSKDIVLTKENVVKHLRLVNDLNSESVGVIYTIDFEDKTLTATMYAIGTSSDETLYSMVAHVMDEVVENFKKF